MSSNTEASDLAAILADQRLRIVLAESCTAGLVSSLLASVPGISAYLCGSMVVYQNDCKQQWLGIPAEMLKRHSAVSSIVTQRMSMQVLQRTTGADLSAAVTGHLGPEAPAALDGRCYVAIARRTGDTIEVVREVAFELVSSTRTDRQLEAARRVLTCLAELLRPHGGVEPPDGGH